METETNGFSATLSSMIECLPVVNPCIPPELILTPESTGKSFAFPVSESPSSCAETLSRHFSTKLGTESDSDCDPTDNTLVGNSAGFSTAGGDSDHESVSSDYSEMADAVKEHLANMHVLQEAELKLSSVLGIPGSSLPRHRLLMHRNPDENEEEFRRRQRKLNFLSLAQEFAELKVVNAEALPFNLHQRKSLGSIDDKFDHSQTENESESQSGEITCDSGIACSDTSSADTNSISTVGALEDCIPDIVRDLHSDASEIPSGITPAHHSNTTTVIPAGNSKPSECSCKTTAADGNFEIRSRLALLPCQKCLDDKRQQHLRQQRDRENIRLRLVLGSEDDSEDVMSLNSRIASAANLTSCHESSASLRVCYVNEAAFDDDFDSIDNELCADVDEEDAGIQLRPDLIANTVNASSLLQQRITATSTGHHITTTSTGHHITTTSTGHHNPFTSVKHEDVVVPRNEICRQSSTFKHNEAAELMAWKMNRFDQLSLQHLGTGQLQFIINDQLSRIEALNLELVECLMERDDLHRTQDSLLVDLEDTTGFLSKKIAATTTNN